MTFQSSEIDPGALGKHDHLFASELLSKVDPGGAWEEREKYLRIFTGPETNLAQRVIDLGGYEGQFVSLFYSGGQEMIIFPPLGHNLRKK